MLELTVKVININLSSGHRPLKKCRPVYEYSWFIQRIRDYQSDGWGRDDAITQAVQDCPDAGISVEREEAYEDGVAEGASRGISLGDLNRSRQDIFDLLEDLGAIPEDIQSHIQAEKDTQLLRRCLKTAARAMSFDDFREKMGQFGKEGIK